MRHGPDSSAGSTGVRMVLRFANEPLFASVQPPPTNSPARIRSIHTSFAGESGAFRRASPRSVSSWKVCLSDAPKPPLEAGTRTRPRPASMSQRTCSKGKVRCCSRSRLPAAMLSKIGWKRAESSASVTVAGTSRGAADAPASRFAGFVVMVIVLLR